MRNEKIPVPYRPQLDDSQPVNVDYTMYHFVLYLTNGKIYPRKDHVGPWERGELRFYAKCSEALDIK